MNARLMTGMLQGPPATRSVCIGMNQVKGQRGARLVGYLVFIPSMANSTIASRSYVTEVVTSSDSLVWLEDAEDVRQAEFTSVIKKNLCVKKQMNIEAWSNDMQNAIQLKGKAMNTYKQEVYTNKSRSKRFLLPVVTFCTTNAIATSPYTPS